MIIHFSVTSLEAVVPKINVYVLLLPHKLQNRKLLNKLESVLLYCPKSFTKELAKRSHMNIQFFFACKDLRRYDLLIRIG